MDEIMPQWELSVYILWYETTAKQNVDIAPTGYKIYGFGILAQNGFTWDIFN